MVRALPLEGLKVVAIEQAVAAPFATARLADAGAQVTKIERPGGDFARGYDAAARGQSSYFVWLNRGKISETVDLHSDAGKARLRALLSEADVLVQNLKPGALAKLGFGLQHLRAAYPALITCSITGYGQSGPMMNRKAYDLLIQAETGLCTVTGGLDEPARVGISVVDIATGATAYSAILEALLMRANDGEGANISVSMFDVMADWLTVPLLNHENGDTPLRLGLRHPSIAPYGVFLTRDETQLLIAVQSDREWRALCAAFIGKPDLGTDPSFATNVDRVRNRAETDGAVAAAFATYWREDAIEALAEANIAFAAVNDMAGLSDHPHLRRTIVETPNGIVSIPAPAPIFDGEERHFGPVPPLSATST